MIKFKKDYSLKIVSLLLAAVFLLNTTIYGIDLSNKSQLRVPSIFQDQESLRKFQKLTQSQGSIRDLPVELELKFSELDPGGYYVEAKNMRAMRGPSVEDIIEYIDLSPLSVEHKTGDTLAEIIWDVLSNYKVRRSSRAQIDAVKEDTLRIIQDAIDNKRPIELFLLVLLPKLRNPLVSENRSLADMGEIVALAQMLRIHKLIQQVYPPGMRFVVAYEGTALKDMFNYSPTQNVQQNIKSLRYVIDLLHKRIGQDNVIIFEDLDALLKEIPEYNENLKKEKERLEASYMAWDSEIRDLINNWVSSFGIIVYDLEEILDKKGISHPPLTTKDRLTVLTYKIPDDDLPAYLAKGRKALFEKALEEAFNYWSLYDVKYKGGKDNLGIRQKYPHSIPTTLHGATLNGGAPKYNIMLLPSSHKHRMLHTGVTVWHNGRLVITYLAALQKYPDIFAAVFCKDSLKTEGPFLYVNTSQPLPPFIKQSTHLKRLIASDAKTQERVIALKDVFGIDEDRLLDVIADESVRKNVNPEEILMPLENTGGLLFEPPDIVTIGAGASGTWNKDLYDAMGWKSNSLITTFDSGGDTGYIQAMIREKMNCYLFGLGDLGTNITRVSSPAMQKVLLTRFDENIPADRRFSNEVKSVLKKVAVLYPGSANDVNFLRFAASLLGAADVIDREFIDKGVFPLAGRSIKNLFVLGLICYTKGWNKGDINSAEVENALRLASHIVGADYSVFCPASIEPAVLYAVYQDSEGLQQVAKGDSDITFLPRGSKILEFGFAQEKLPEANPEALQSIKLVKKVILFGPGNFFCSMLSHLITKGVCQALIERKDIAKVFVMPPIIIPETQGLRIKDYIEMTETLASKAMGRPVKFEEIFTHVVINKAPSQGEDMKIIRLSSGEGADKKSLGLFEVTKDELAVFEARGIRVIQRPLMDVIEMSVKGKEEIARQSAFGSQLFCETVRYLWNDWEGKKQKIDSQVLNLISARELETAL